MTEIIENLDDFDFEGEDLNKVLNSTIISASNKNQFINGIEEQKIFDAPQNVQLVLSFLNQNSFLEIKNSLLNKLLLSSHGTTNTRIEVFNARHLSIESEEVINFLESLPGDFKEIPNPNRRAPIPYSTVNEELLKILRDKEIINNYSKKKERLRVSHKRS